MNVKDYNRFEDFVMDDFFKEFVTGKRKESVEFWNQWLLEHPDKKDEVQKASDVLLILLNHKKRAIEGEKQAALKLLLSSVEKLNHVSTFRKYSIWCAKVAAVILLSVGLAFAWNALFTKQSTSEQPVAYNDIIVPVGEKSQIILSDGTHVWINSGSRFRYKVDFGKDLREVMLEGEAYFDVTKGRKSFVVNTHDAQIKVLGTAFNVKSYPEDKKTQTTVVRGLVRVISKEKGIKPVLIGPDEMAILSDLTGEEKKDTQTNRLYVHEKVNTGAITSWKDQLLVFADETFEDMGVKMERWFDMKIRIEDETLKKERYTGKFVNNETVYQVLEAIGVTTPIEYKVEKDEIIITRKRP